MKDLGVLLIIGVYVVVYNNSCSWIDIVMIHLGSIVLNSMPKWDILSHGEEPL